MERMEKQTRRGRAYETALPQCRYREHQSDPHTQCSALARYVLLDPPMVVQRTPTPVWLEGEYRSPAKTARRRTPQYCRVHAYVLCNLPVPDPVTPF